MITTFEQYLYENNDSLSPIEVPTCIVDTANAITTYRNSPRLNQDSEIIQNITRENSPKIIQYLHRHPEHIQIIGWEKMDDNWNFSLSFNITTYVFGLEIDNHGFTGLFYLDGWYLPVEVPDKTLLRKAVQTAVQTYIQANPSRYYELPPIGQEWCRKMMQVTGTDFGFLEAYSLPVARDFLTTFYTQIQDLGQNYNNNRTKILKLMAGNTAKFLAILTTFLKYTQLQKIDRWDDNHPMPCFVFTLWDLEFTVVLNSDLEFAHILLGEIGHIGTVKNSAKFVRKFLQHVHHIIETQPGLYTELPPKLQQQWAHDFKSFGTDFGFLETVQYEVLADFINTPNDYDFLTKLSQKVLVLALKKNGSDMETLLREAKDRVYTIVKKHPTEMTAWKTWTRDNATDVLQFDLWNSTFCLWLAKWPNRFSYDNYFLLENYSIPITREEGNALVPLVLTELKAAITQDPSLYSNLTPSLQRYFAADFKHLGTDFGFFK